MIVYFEKRHKSFSYRILSAFIAFTFIFSVVLPPGYAQVGTTILNLPAPGTMVSVSPAFTPALINGITIHPENPLEFDFIVGTGDERLQGKAFEDESTKLIKYFLASLTVPEDEMWVNLSPYEKDRIIPQGFGTTEMGRDLLAQDYILKQLTASLMYPEKELGSEFWKKIYQKAYEQYGTTEIPMNTFNKVWIVPEKAVVYEHGNSAFVVKSHLKVMLEEDYVAMNSSVGNADLRSLQGQGGVSSEIIKEIILPEIEKEVNEGKGFANLRQIYNSAILAAWFKQNLKQTLLGQVYVDKTKTKGIDVEDKTVNEKIYAQYLEAFKKGVYNYIKEDTDPVTQEVIPRKYFSGGTNLKVSDLVETYKNGQPLSDLRRQILKAYLAGQSSDQQEVNINLLELSEKTSVADAQQAIASSQRATNDERRLSGEAERASISAKTEATSDETASSPVTTGAQGEEDIEPGRGAAEPISGEGEKKQAQKAREDYQRMIKELRIKSGERLDYAGENSVYQQKTQKLMMLVDALVDSLTKGVTPLQASHHIRTILFESLSLIKTHLKDYEREHALRDTVLQRASVDDTTLAGLILTFSRVVFGETITLANKIGPNQTPYKNELEENINSIHAVDSGYSGPGVKVLKEELTESLQTLSSSSPVAKSVEVAVKRVSERIMMLEKQKNHHFDVINKKMAQNIFILDDPLKNLLPYTAISLSGLSNSTGIKSFSVMSNFLRERLQRDPNNFSIDSVQAISDFVVTRINREIKRNFRTALNKNKESQKMTLEETLEDLEQLKKFSFSAVFSTTEGNVKKAAEILYDIISKEPPPEKEVSSSPVEAVLPRVNPTKTESWIQLKELAANRKYDLRALFDADVDRAKKLSVELDAGFKVDFSKNLIDEETLAVLLKLAEEVSLGKAIEQMFTGEKINETEKRAVLHTALRNVTRKDGTLVAANGPVYVDGEDVMPEVIAVLNKMEAFARKVRTGEWKGATGKRIKHVVNVGIGGSDLGPKMTAEALKPYGRDSGITAHFVSNVDGTAAAELIRELGNPEETLIVIESKTFTTQETIQNATTLKNWVTNYYKEKEGTSSEDAIKKHFVAVSTAKDLVEAFGIDPENMFAFWDWVGGRYSMWSAIGLTLAVFIGFDNFLEMLEGAREADEHFRNQSFDKNIPVLKALLGVWNRIFFNAETHAILPYDEYLSLLPAFLQQGFMESQGKGADRSGNFITDYKTGQIIWGAAGTDGQHSFYQLMHQSPSIVPADFIGVARTQNPLPGHHEKLYSNFVAQPYALAFGSKLEEVMKALDDGKMSPEELRWLAAHRTFPGNKPTTSIFIDEMTPRALGKLIVMYEHQIMAEGIIYNIFSFDQWGVQLGKVVATKNVLDFLNGARPMNELDSVPYGNTIRDVVEGFIKKQPKITASSPVAKSVEVAVKRVSERIMMLEKQKNHYFDVINKKMAQNIFILDDPLKNLLPYTAISLSGLSNSTGIKSFSVMSNFLRERLQRDPNNFSIDSVQAISDFVVTRINREIKRNFRTALNKNKESQKMTLEETLEDLEQLKKFSFSAVFSTTEGNVKKAAEILYDIISKEPPPEKEVSSSPVEVIKELTPSSTPQEIENVVRLASEKQHLEGDPDAVALAGTLKYEGKQMRFEDGYLVSFNGKPILRRQASWRGPSPQPEIFKVNDNPPVHFTSTTIYLEIPGDREHILKIDSTRVPVKNWYVVSRISRGQFEMEKEYPSLFEIYEILAEGIISDSMKISLSPSKTVSLDVLVKMLGWPREKVVDTIKKIKSDSRFPIQIEPDELDAATTLITVSRKQSASSPVGVGDLEEIKRLFREQILAWYTEDVRELKSLETFSWEGLKNYFTMDSEAAAMGKRFSKLEEIFKEKQNRRPTNQELEDLLSALSKEEGEAAGLFLISAVMNDFIDDASGKFIKRLFKGPASSPAEDSRQSSDVSLQPAVSEAGPLTTDDGRLMTKPGGIDLNPALLDLQIKRDGNGIPLPLPQQPIEDMHIEGFIPIIINVTPIFNLPLLLGLADTEQDTEETMPAMKAREPEEVSYLN